MFFFKCFTLVTIRVVSSTPTTMLSGPGSEPHVVDLRSDCLSQPTKAMMEAMADVVLRDDVFNEDPTIKSKEYFAITFYAIWS